MILNNWYVFQIKAKNQLRVNGLSMSMYFLTYFTILIVIMIVTCAGVMALVSFAYLFIYGYTIDIYHLLDKEVIFNILICCLIKITTFEIVGSISVARAISKGEFQIKL